jgi:thioredoxin reductase
MIDALPWDPEMESPATIAILGAGPMGIEAALYARFLGYHVSIFETRRVAHRMLDWNNRKIDSPVGQITTSLGLRVSPSGRRSFFYRQAVR